ncbi:MAG: hypothetical protein L0H79_19695 [Intrasporangium sp.]|uniref:hypothetical protein n=1 Tax=Intrasporangium sp. TaxID=1925024 RepID=UPI002648AC2D|nr:hypothetical protein [Intrasporangium sp.]MDN5797949.1 hypothetical protein [Intrasporangium sp.]
MKVLWGLALATPPVCAYLLQWLPALNGPHLWLGLPTILWWTTVPGSALVVLVLVFIEQTRTDDDEQDRLDDQAAREADQREAERRRDGEKLA